MIRVTREDLISDIQLAIGLNLWRIPRRGEHLAVEASKPLAEIIATHLERSGCEIFRKVRGPGHSSPPAQPTRPGRL